MGDHLLYTCHACGADWRDIERMLGVERGDHAEACAHDEGPFYPQEAVLANVKPWRFTPSSVEFPEGPVGEIAQALHEYVPDARRATRRLKHPPDEALYCVRFSMAAMRKIWPDAPPIQRDVEAACRLLKEMFVTSEYRTQLEGQDGFTKTLLFIIVHPDLASSSSISPFEPQPGSGIGYMIRR